MKWIIPFLYLIFFAGFICSFRAVSSLSTAALLLAGIIINWKQLKESFRNKDHRILLFAGLAYLLLILFYCILKDQPKNWTDLQLKSAMVLIPLAVICSLPGIKKDQLLYAYCGMLFLASVYCLIFSPSLYYHQLVSPLRQHAVYFSIYVFVALVFLVTRLRAEKNKKINALLLFGLLFFTAFLFLLSSRIVLLFFIVYVIWELLAKKYKPAILVLLVAAALLLTKNKISERFNDMFNGSPALATQESFNPGIYFNGVQFRLLQWKLVPHILNKEQAWISGVGPERAQVLLDSEYIARNMYTGEEQRGDHGYLQYNTHNQFLQSLLVYGIAGSLLFCCFCLGLIRLAMARRSAAFWFIVLLLIAYSAIESVLETQYGILLFTFFPVFLAYNVDEPTEAL
jgi:O-antigen ligase